MNAILISRNLMLKSVRLPSRDISNSLKWFIGCNVSNSFFILYFWLTSARCICPYQIDHFLSKKSYFLIDTCNVDNYFSGKEFLINNFFPCSQVRIFSPSQTTLDMRVIAQ